jgi:hypothetical protein
MDVTQQPHFAFVAVGTDGNVDTGEFLDHYLNGYLRAVLQIR